MEQLGSLESFEPHRVNPNGFVVALGAMPAAWLATVSRRGHSVDVLRQTRSFSPGNRRHPVIKELCW